MDARVAVALPLSPETLVLDAVGALTLVLSPETFVDADVAVALLVSPEAVRLAAAAAEALSFVLVARGLCGPPITLVRLRRSFSRDGGSTGLLWALRAIPRGG